MSIPAEFLLMAIAVGIYLYDGLLLLYCNEGILYLQGKGWKVAFGTDKARLRGRDLFLPSPLAPHRPIFRLGWKFEGGQAGNDQIDWEKLAGEFSGLSPFIYGIVLSLFCLLPLGLFTRLGNLLILAAVVFLYSNILAALVWIWLHRDRFGLTGKAFAAMAFESLVCSPCALNLVRKLSLGMGHGGDLLVAAGRLQSAEDLALTRARCAARLEEEMEGEEDGRRLSLLQQRKQELIQGPVECLPPN